MIDFMYRFILISLILITSVYAESKTSLLSGIARDTIVGDLYHQNLIDSHALNLQYPFLKKKGATFVTLSKNSHLRGCIGSLHPFRSLLDDLVSNSRSAAFSDPRFRALRSAELSHLEVEVSVLTQPQEIKYKNIADLREHVVVREDGIVLTDGRHRATYLPQVWESLPQFEPFFASLCKKAGLAQNCLKSHPKIEKYQVHKYSESDLSQRPMGNIGRFYAASCQTLEKQFQSFDTRASQEHKLLSSEIPRAMIVPHAGYIYSGYTASLVYREAQKSRAKRIILIGPSHRLSFRGVSISTYESFKTPCGLIRSDEAYVKQLQKRFSLKMIRELHDKEHSTEVQLPLINHYLPQMKVVELIYGDVSTQALSKMMKVLLKDKENLVIVSSDLSHFYPQKEAQDHDFICLESVENVDPKHLQAGCEACGYRGIESLLIATQDLKMKSKLIDYRSSADASGDKARVVGYMGAIFW